MTARPAGKTPEEEIESKNITTASEVSEAEIAVHWQEEGYYHPPATFIAHANLTDAAVHKRFSLENFPECFKEYADLLTWFKYWKRRSIPATRCSGAGLSAAGSTSPITSYNCVDRHLEKHRDKTAIHFVPELEQDPIQHITYQELYVRVNEVAAMLRISAG